MSRGHHGWDDEFDRQFDDRAVWFHLETAGKHLAGLRLIFHQMGVTAGPLPSDLGDLDVFHPQESDRPICESSGLSFRSRKGLTLLLPVFIRWMMDRQLGPVYSLYDASNEFVHWLQCELLCFRHVPGGQVTFEGFTYRGGERDGVPVTWQATVLDPLMRNQAWANATDHAWEVWDGPPPRLELIDHVSTDALEPVTAPAEARQVRQSA